MAHCISSRTTAAVGRHRAPLSGLLAAMLTLTALGGCTSMKAYTDAEYDRGSASADKFRTDSRACEKQAEAHGKEHGFGPYDPTHGAYNRMYDACMRSSGYPRKPGPPE